MTLGLWRVALGGGERLARGEPESGPTELLDDPGGPGIDGPGIDGLIALGAPALAEALASPGRGPLPDGAAILPPIGSQEIWAAGVTFLRSREARMEESGTPDHYDLVYEAERPELFLKATPGKARGPGQAIGIRADSTWDVPEPELVVVADSQGRPAAYTIGNDVSSRSIEGENPLYLPQAKVYRGSCAIGPCLVPAGAVPGLEGMDVALSIMRGGAEIFSDSVALSTMKRRPGELVEWLFRAQEFPEGAALLTGTSIVPPPELTLQEGDTVTVSITGLGRLVNPVELVGVPRRAAAAGGPGGSAP
ncbi:MAG: fumarylacetoacetate hydrolase family protein [Acidimicrobiales bacterium]